MKAWTVFLNGNAKVKGQTILEHFMITTKWVRPIISGGINVYMKT